MTTNTAEEFHEPKPRKKMTHSLLEDERNLCLSDQEIVDFISERSALEAIRSARERMNLMLAVAGILLTITAGLVFFTLEAYVNAAADRKIALLKSELEDALATNLNEKATDVQTEVLNTVEERVSSAVALTLLASEGNSFRAGQGYNDVAADRYIALLRMYRSNITALEGEMRQIAFRRIEDIMDVFVNAGDYARAFKIYRQFDEEMPFDRGIYQTLALATSSYVILDDNNAAKIADISERLTKETFTADLPQHLEQRVLQTVLTIDKAEWSEAVIKEKLCEQDAADSFFINRVTQVWNSLEAEIQPEKINHSLEALNRHAVLGQAIEGLGTC